MRFLPSITEDALFALLRECREASERAQFEGQDETRTPEVIYHYTRAAGVLGMVRDHSLHATHIHFLNDPSEGTLSQTLLDSDLIHGAFEGLALDAQPVDSLLKRLANHALDSTKSTYVACFSSDGDLIDQWRAYGNNGCGYSVGFETSALLEALEDRPRIVRVRYESADPARTWLAHARPYLTRFLEESRLWNWPSFEDDLIGALLPMTVEFAIRSKHGSYRNEREIRLAFFDPGDTGRRAPTSFRCSSNYLVPFMPLPLKSLPIREVIVGPCLDFEYARNGIDALLRTNGLSDIPIRRSDLPYRRT